MVAQVRNVHGRTFPAPVEVLADALDRIGCDADVLWPSPAWWPMRMHPGDGAGRVSKRPILRRLAVGATGGHGPIRYTVTEYEPGRRVRFAFDPRTGLDGHHEAVLEPVPDAEGGGCRLTHVIDIRPRGRARVLWPLVIRRLHDALLEDLLDRAERVATGRVASPARWSRTARLAHRLLWDRPRAVDIPEAARLARAAYDRTDLADAYQVELRPGMSADPQVWARAVLADPPRWVRAAMGARNALVGLVGIERSDGTLFAPVAAHGGEVLVGRDAGHLGFRVSLLVEPDGRGVVTVSTVAQTFNRRGRAYLAVVRLVHPRVVRAMVRRGSRRLALATSASWVQGGAGPGVVPHPA